MSFVVGNGCRSRQALRERFGSLRRDRGFIACVTPQRRRACAIRSGAKTHAARREPKMGIDPDTGRGVFFDSDEHTSCTRGGETNCGSSACGRPRGFGCRRRRLAHDRRPRRSRLPTPTRPRDRTLNDRTRVHSFCLGACPSAPPRRFEDLTEPAIRPARTGVATLRQGHRSRVRSQRPAAPPALRRPALRSSAAVPRRRPRSVVPSA